MRVVKKKNIYIKVIVAALECKPCSDILSIKISNNRPGRQTSIYPDVYFGRNDVRNFVDSSNIYLVRLQGTHSLRDDVTLSRDRPSLN